MNTVDCVWVDKCIVQVGHTYIHCRKIFTEIWSTCIVQSSLFSICIPRNLLDFVSDMISLSSSIFTSASRVFFLVNTMYMVFFILNVSLLILNHFKMFASSWLSASWKMSLSWLKRSLSSTNNIGKDKVQTSRKSFIWIKKKCSKNGTLGNSTL